jgi:hypothetical protein
LNLAARKDQWARFGVWRGFYGLVLDALEKTLDLHVFLVNRNPHTDGQEVPEEIARTFEFRVLTADEVRRAARDPDLEMTPEFAESALTRGDYCFGVLRGDRLVAYDWRGLGQPVPYDDDLEIHYSHPGQVYGYAMYTRPEYRGLRLQLYSLRCAETRLLAEDHTDTIGYVAVQNFASIRNLSRIRGQVFVGIAGYLRLGGRYVTFRTPGAKRYGFKIARASHRDARTPTREIDGDHPQAVRRGSAQTGRAPA